MCFLNLGIRAAVIGKTRKTAVLPGFYRKERGSPEVLSHICGGSPGNFRQLGHYIQGVPH